MASCGPTSTGGASGARYRLALLRSRHTPPNLQGSPSHSLMSTSQFLPGDNAARQSAPRGGAAGGRTLTREAGVAGAAVVVELVHAGGSVAAGRGRALVDVDGAVVAGEAGAAALAAVAVERVHAAAPVLARLRLCQ